MNLLSPEEIEELSGRLTGWAVADGALVKGYEFEDYLSGIRFVDALAELAESEDHHPDLEVGYGRVTVRFSTHSEGGLTRKDFRMAEGTDGL